MKLKKIVLAFMIIAGGGLYFWSLTFENTNSQDLKFEAHKELITSTVAIKMVTSFENNSSKTPHPINERSEVENLEYFNEIYSIVAPKDGSVDKVEPGEEIGVENFFDSQHEYSYFVPLFFNSKVVAVSIFRKYTQGEKKLGRVGEIWEDWFSYPPIVLGDATNTLLSNYPGLSVTNISGFFYIEDGETPYYLYEGENGNVTKYYLVSAYDKHIVVKNTRILEIAEEEPVPGRINSQGYLEIDELMASKFSKEEQRQLRREAHETNKYIRDGVMKFDKDMNIIFDKRTEEDFERERSLDEEEMNEVPPNDSYDRSLKIDFNNLNNSYLEKK